VRKLPPAIPTASVTAPKNATVAHQSDETDEGEDIAGLEGFELVASLRSSERRVAQLTGWCGLGAQAIETLNGS
jgi:hypothetical protein